MKMYFTDLSQYCYHLPDNCEFENVLNIGWLDSDHSFPTGTVDSLFFERLRRLFCSLKTDLKIHVNQIRGQHPCNLCGEYVEVLCENESRTRLLGSVQIWVPSVDGQYIYAAPSLILHYIEQHSYIPPIEFVEAVLSFNESQEFNGQKTYETLTKKIMDE